MGNHKFKISNMIPNSWIHKLKDMTKQSNPKTKSSSSSSSSNTCNKKKPSSDSLPHHHSSNSYSSNSLVANTSLHNSPRNSLYTRRVSKRKTLYKSSLRPLSPPLVSASFNGQDSSYSLFPALEPTHESLVYSFYEEEDDEFVNFTNFKINTKNKAFTKNKVKDSDLIEKSCSVKKSHLSVKIHKEGEEDDVCGAKKKNQKQVSSGRKSSAGINLKRVNSPRIQLSGTRRSTSRSERKQDVLESFAVMKRSLFESKKVS